MADDQQREAPQDSVLVPQIELGSSPEDSCRESSSSSEKAIKNGESSTDSPKRSSPFTSGPDSSNPMSVPARSRSAHAAVYTDQSSGAIPKRRAYDSPADSSGERESSKEYPKLMMSQSSDSHTCVPKPDVEVAKGRVKQKLEAVNAGAGLYIDTVSIATVGMKFLATEERDPIEFVGVGPDTTREVEPSIAESEQSSTPDTVKRTGEDEPKSSQTSSPGNVEEVKPTTVEDEPMTSQSSISGKFEVKPTDDE